jgi:coenzyme Q-binding protein COQ10
MPGYEVHRVLPFRGTLLFDLVADVERYPEFVPWWAAARITGHEGDTYRTDQVVRFGPLHRRFVTETRLFRPKRIEVTSKDRGFRRFHIDWRFDTGPEDGCAVSLIMKIELNWRPAQEVLGAVMASAPDRLVAAFEARARQVYGASR